MTRRRSLEEDSVAQQFTLISADKGVSASWRSRSASRSENERTFQHGRHKADKPVIGRVELAEPKSAITDDVDSPLLLLSSSMKKLK